MERVAGIQTGGSERAFDLYMKGRYLDEIHPGRGLVGASGTPVSNSMVEMYTMQKYFDPEGLREPRHRALRRLGGHLRRGGRGDGDFSPDGATLKPRSRFAKFVNLPELVQMFRSLRRRPDGGHARPAAPRPGRRQAAHGRLPDVRGAESPARRAGRAVRAHPQTERVDPREDNALAITTDGRKLALDGRMLAAGGDFPDSKVNALVRNVVRIWRQTEDPKRGTQMIFCDMGVNPNPFSAYDELAWRSWSSGGHSRRARSPSWATPTPTPRSRPCSRRSGRAPCACSSAAPPEDGHRHQRAEAAGGPAPPGRPVEARRGGAAGRPHPPPGQQNAEVSHLPLRHRGLLSTPSCGRRWRPRPGSSPR